MKKIAFILFLVSFNLNAESFFLVCDGVEDQRLQGEVLKINKSIGIEVTDQALILGGKRFTKEPNDLSTYLKTKQKIEFTLTEFLEDKIGINISGDIDRISGQIYYEKNQPIVNSFIFFDGKCKKAKDKAI
jgi:hypothetical protein